MHLSLHGIELHSFVGAAVRFPVGRGYNGVKLDVGRHIVQEVANLLRCQLNYIKKHIHLGGAVLGGRATARLPSRTRKGGRLGRSCR